MAATKECADHAARATQLIKIKRPESTSEEEREQLAAQRDTIGKEHVASLRRLDSLKGQYTKQRDKSLILRFAYPTADKVEEKALRELKGERH